MRMSAGPKFHVLARICSFAADYIHVNGQIQHWDVHETSSVLLHCRK